MIEILMLGGTGFLGTNIICEIFSLNRSDIKVDIFSRGFSKTSKINKRYICTLENIDILEKENVLKNISKYDYIIDLAETADVGAKDIGIYLDEIEKYFTLLKSKGKYIYISSSEVYGHVDCEEGIKITESTIPKPESIYALRKIIKEQELFWLSYKFEKDILVVRPCSVYGKYQYDKKLITQAIRHFLFKIPLNITNPDLVKNYISAKDFSKILCKLILEDKKGIYNISTNENYSNYQIVEMIAHTLKFEVSNIAHDTDEAFQRNNDGNRYSTNSYKLLEDTDWKPTHSLLTDLNEIIQGIKEYESS